MAWDIMEDNTKEAQGGDSFSPMVRWRVYAQAPLCLAPRAPPGPREVPAYCACEICDEYLSNKPKDTGKSSPGGSPQPQMPSMTERATMKRCQGAAATLPVLWTSSVKGRGQYWQLAWTLSPLSTKQPWGAGALGTLTRGRKNRSFSGQEHGARDRWSPDVNQLQNKSNTVFQKEKEM